MAKVTIDGKEYDSEQLPEKIQKFLGAIQFVERRINDLQAELTAMQTTRNAYVRDLKAMETEYCGNSIFASVMSEINISLESKPVHHENHPIVPPVGPIIVPPAITSNIISGKPYSLSELKNKHLGKKNRPVSLIIKDHTIKVSNWSDLSIKFVEWLIKNNFLTQSKLPIYTYSESDKFFINSSPQHKIAGKNAYWNSVMGNFHIDTKYDAEGHKKNMIQALKHLDIVDVDIKIAFR